MTTPNATANALRQFTPMQQQHIRNLINDMDRPSSPLDIEFGETDDGAAWASIQSNGKDLASVLAGLGTNGRGHVVVDGLGRCIGSPRGTLDYGRILGKVRRHIKAAVRSMGPEYR
jgi:hypothetical protein